MNYEKDKIDGIAQTMEKYMHFFKSILVDEVLVQGHYNFFLFKAIFRFVDDSLTKLAENALK